MSEDLIRRNDAIKVVRHSSMEFIDADTRQKLVEAIPTIEIPQTPKGDVIGYKWVLEWILKPLPHTRVSQIQSIEPKLGRWIYQFRDSENEEYRCSECNYIGDNGWAFCPHCGAYMEGGKE